MARELAGIKVKIGLDNKGFAKYPDFNSLTVVKDSGLDWAKYVDVHGLGWHYDDTSGHKDDTLDSPFGQQWGLLMAPETFADEAVAAFPAEVAKLTEVELEDFFDNKAHVNEPDELLDEQVLSGIKLKQDLGQALTAQQTKALDPTNDVPGIRQNRRKTWQDYKALKGVTVKKAAKK